MAAPQIEIPAAPSLGQWLKMFWLDILTLLSTAGAGVLLWIVPRATSRSFPIMYHSGDVVYPQFAYPVRADIIPTWLSAVISGSVPITIFILMQFRRHLRISRFWDLNNAIFGLLYSLITAGIFQMVIKILVGGLRPHFLAACKPDMSLVQQGIGFGNIMHNRTICRGDNKLINDSLESFPSGHSTAAFASFVFLSLYLNAKLKPFSNSRLRHWKLVTTTLPLLGAVLIVGQLTIDKAHNWYDILAGAVLGTIMAFGSYRGMYASIWDFNTNHIPLTEEKEE